jgi:stage II sporulation protein GA (sporulation sigma-E factor processing peptidase)
MIGNLYLLSLARRILQCTATHKRIWLSAAAGAGITCMVIMIPIGIMGIRLLFAAIPVSMVMLKLAYGERGFRKLFHSSLCMAGCGFFLGSAMIWFLNRMKILLKGYNSLLLTLVIEYLAYILLCRVVVWLQRRKESCLRTVCIYVPPLGEYIRAQALVDTGNHLTDPVSGKPVSIISEKLSRCLSPCFVPEKYHVIPYQSVGRNRGMLNGYELPELVIEDCGRQIRKESAIVAICDTGIPEESIYQMILHPRLLKIQEEEKWF